MKTTLLRIIFCWLWMFAYYLVVTHLPKTTGVMLVGFPIAFIGFLLIMYLFRDKDTKTTEEQH